MLKLSVAWSLISKQLNPVLDGPYLPPSDPASRRPRPALCPRGMDMTYKVIHWLPCPAPSGWPMGRPRMKVRVKSGYLPSWLPACQLQFPDRTQQSLFQLQELLPAPAPLGLEEVRELHSYLP